MGLCRHVLCRLCAWCLNLANQLTNHALVLHCEVNSSCFQTHTTPFCCCRCCAVCTVALHCVCSALQVCIWCELLNLVACGHASWQDVHRTYHTEEAMCRLLWSYGCFWSVGGTWPGTSRVLQNCNAYRPVVSGLSTLDSASQALHSLAQHPMTALCDWKVCTTNRKVWIAMCCAPEFAIKLKCPAQAAQNDLHTAGGDAYLCCHNPIPIRNTHQNLCMQ